MSTVTDEGRARVQEVVDQMARSVGLEPARVRVRHTKACARVTAEPRGAVALDADPKLAHAHLSVLRKMLAHELAHVWCCVVGMGWAAWTAPLRAHEREADRAAVDLFGIGLDNELRDWMQTNGFGDPRAPGFMRTHPKLDERARATATHQQQARRRMKTTAHNRAS